MVPKQTFTTIAKALTQKGIPFEEITFTDTATSARTADTSLEKNYDPQTAIKTLIISTPDGFKAVILRGDQRIDQKKLKNIVGKWQVVDPQTLEGKFGFQPGCICPLDLDLSILIDKDATKLPKWSMGAGDQQKGINIETAIVLENLPKHQLISISSPDSPPPLKTSAIKDLSQRLNLIRQVGEEIIEEDELKQLLQSGEQLIAYDGFEPSGQMHIAQGILRAININKMIQAGVKFKMLVADWHAWANNKMGGELETIQTVGKYFIEVWKASGMNLKNVEFVWASNLVKKDSYWKTVLQIARQNTVNRIIRCAEIMGRQESFNLSTAQIIYPCMQAADIFILGAQITQLGMDQRKVNMLAREVGPHLGFWKPVVVSHHMLLGLQKPVSKTTDAKQRAIELKMSKSLPDTAIFMTDTSEDIERKITKAWCPEGEIQENPILEYCKYILFEKFPSLTIERPQKFGGQTTFSSYQELEQAFAQKQLHPQDLKKAATHHLDLLLQPVRNHFVKNLKAKKLLNQVQSFQISR